jgi:hypothetical protein
MSMTELHSDTGWVRLAGSGSNGVWYRTKSGICTIMADGGGGWGGSPKANSSVTVGTLPASARPSHDVRTPLAYKGGSVVGALSASSAGVVQIVWGGSVGSYWAATLTYPV